MNKYIIKYSRFQFGWVIVILFMIINIWFTLAYIYQWGNNPLGKPEFIFFLVLFGGILLTFYGIRVIVNEKQIVIEFGIGLFKKRIDLTSVKSVRQVKFPVYYGYGIRLIPNGTLYNVSGRYAVELQFKHKKGVIQIGTNDSDNLKSVIEERLTR